MSNAHSTINCPKCGTSINIEEALYSQLQTKFDVDMTQERQKYKNAIQNLHKDQESLKTQKLEYDKNFQDALDKGLSSERVKIKESISKEIKASVQADSALEIKQLQEELDTKSKQVQELNASKATIAKLNRQMQEVESKAKADAQIELNKLLEKEQQKLQKTAQELNDSKLKAKDEQLEQVKKQLDDALRKVEQGSQQIQGETQEKNIEDYLELNFKYDDIQEVKKGAFGADCVQTINTPDFSNCGKICYESKNTKSFSGEWIKKLKQDMLDAGADVGVLVTTALPKDMQRMGFIDGVWVCSYEEFKGTSALIRDGVIGAYKASRFQENRVDKMNLLYSYFTSNEFSGQLTSIVEGFVSMQEELNKQKRSVMSSWKRQQKHIDTVLLNTTNMYGSIKGIAGNAIADVTALELEHIEDSDEDDEN